MYSSTVRRLISELPGRGELDGATHRSRVENPVCGDVTCFTLKVSEGFVVECRFQSMGCPGAIAAAAAVVEIIRSRAVEDCLRIRPEEVLEYLEGLPPHKRHGVDLAIEALRKALISPEARTF